MLNGSSKGWIFSAGILNFEFPATVEDELFLEKVKTRKIKFENGTAIRAEIRTVYKITGATRSIVKVTGIFQP